MRSPRRRSRFAASFLSSVSTDSASSSVTLDLPLVETCAPQGSYRNSSRGSWRNFRGNLEAGLSDNSAERQLTTAADCPIFLRMPYNFTQVEKKWQAYWLANRTFRAL